MRNAQVTYCIQTKYLCKEFFSEFTHRDDIDTCMIENMILSTVVLHLDTSEDASESSTFLDIPIFLQSVEESRTEGISATGRIYWVFYVDGRYGDSGIFGIYISSFFSLGNDSYGSISQTKFYEICPCKLLKHLTLILVHDGEIGPNGQILEFISREYESHLTWVKYPKNTSIFTLLHASLYPFLGIRRDDGMRIWMIIN